MAGGDLEKLLAELARIGGKSVSIGWQGSAASDTYENGETVLNVAIRNHFGQDGIPARPALSIAFQRKAPQLSTVLEKAIKAVAEGRSDAERAAGLVGAYAVGQVQETISEGVPPPNAPYTIEKKSSSKPLIDTGKLRQSITYKVE